MIRKLRIKFVVINMTIVSVMLAIILGLVLYFTEVQIGMQSIRMMQQMSSQSLNLIDPGGEQKEFRLPYIAVRLGPNGEAVSVSSNAYDLSSETFLTEIMDTALGSGSRTGELEEYSMRFSFVGPPQNRYLIFMDTCNEQAALDSLLGVCIFLGVAGFFIFLAISILLSRWAVRPIEEAVQRQEQFIADASHELKTPLTVLISNAQLLRTSSDTPEKKEKLVDAILVMSQQMRSLTNELLTLAHIDAMGSAAPRDRVDLSETIQDAVLPFEPIFFEKGLRLDSEIQSGVAVNGSADHLRQLAEILLDNAQKYSSDGGRTAVTLSRSGKNRCILTVANDGPTLTPEQLKNLFTRFYRADSSRPRNGSFGLGLPIAQAIVKEHRGRLQVESREQVTTFRIELTSI